MVNRLNTKMMNLPQVVLTAASLVAIACSLGCRSKASANHTQAHRSAQAVPVEVAKVTRGAIEAVIQHSTHLEAEEEVKVFARTSNRVIELLVEEGDQVKKDQVLVRLEDDVQKTAFAKAQVRYEKAQQEFNRQKSLFAQKLISEQAFNDAHFEFKQLELALEDARRELDYTQVRAPIAGTVSRRQVKLGDLVSLNQHLFDLVDFASIVARVYVAESDLPQLQLDLPARVIPTSSPDAAVPGYVMRIAPIVEAKSGLVKVTIGFKDVRQLRPGMFVNVELITARHPQALLISKRALVYDGESSYVFRLLPGRVVERVPVLTKVDDEFNIEPASGFQEGDEIVIAGQTGLKHGAKVRLPGDLDPSEQKDKVEKTELAEQRDRS